MNSDLKAITIMPNVSGCSTGAAEIRQKPDARASMVSMNSSNSPLLCPSTPAVALLDEDLFSLDPSQTQSGQDSNTSTQTTSNITNTDNPTASLNDKSLPTSYAAVTKCQTPTSKLLLKAHNGPPPGIFAKEEEVYTEEEDDEEDDDDQDCILTFLSNDSLHHQNDPPNNNSKQDEFRRLQTSHQPIKSYRTTRTCVAVATVPGISAIAKEPAVSGREWQNDTLTANVILPWEEEGSEEDEDEAVEEDELVTGKSMDTCSRKPIDRHSPRVSATSGMGSLNLATDRLFSRHQSEDVLIRMPVLNEVGPLSKSTSSTVTTAAETASNPTTSLSLNSVMNEVDINGKTAAALHRWPGAAVVDQAGVNNQQFSSNIKQGRSNSSTRTTMTGALAAAAAAVSPTVVRPFLVNRSPASYNNGSGALEPAIANTLMSRSSGGGTSALNSRIGDPLPPYYEETSNEACVQTPPGNRTLTYGGGSSSNSRRVVPTAINLKSLQKLRSPTSSGTAGTMSSPGSPLQNSANSVASTSIPQSPLGLDSHFGSDTIQSSNSYHSSPCANQSGSGHFTDWNTTGIDLYGGSNSSTPQSPTGSSVAHRHASHTASNNSHRRASQCAIGGHHASFRQTKGGVNSSASPITSNLQQPTAETPTLKELTPIDADLNPNWWNRLMTFVDPAGGDWEKQFMGLTLFRRLMLYHPGSLDELCSTQRTSSGAGSMANILVSKVLQLTDSGRSMLAKYASMTLHDAYLLCSEKIDGALTMECLQACVKKSVGTSASFLSEEAQRSWKQILLVCDPSRTLTTLGGILTSEIAHSNAALRTKTIVAFGLFILRLNAGDLKNLCNHRAFATSLLKPVLKAVGDPNLECRKSAAMNAVILLNLIPDVLQKFKKALVDLDLFAITDKLKQRKFGWNWHNHFGIETLVESLKLIPESGRSEDTIDSINNILANLENISKHPLLFGDDLFSADFNSKRNSTRAGTLTRRDRDSDFVKPKRPAMGTISGLEGFLRSTMAPSQGSFCRSRNKIALSPTAPKPLTPLRERFDLTNRRSTSARLGVSGSLSSCPGGLYFGSPPPAKDSSAQRTRTDRLLQDLNSPPEGSEDDEEAFEEDQPWYSLHQNEGSDYSLKANDTSDVRNLKERKGTRDLTNYRQGISPKLSGNSRTETPRKHNAPYMAVDAARRPVTPIRFQRTAQATTPHRSDTNLRNKEGLHVSPNVLSTMDSPSRMLATSKIAGTYFGSQGRRVVGGRSGTDYSYMDDFRSARLGSK